MTDYDAQARHANRAEQWDMIWQEDGQEAKRLGALSEVYAWIVAMLPVGAGVIDLGGGIGVLGEMLKATAAWVAVWDHSWVATRAATARGLAAKVADLENPPQLKWARGRPNVAVSTELLEHLTAPGRARLLARVAEDCELFLVSVPNDAMGPEEEEQHAISFTAETFEAELLTVFKTVTVEVRGRYLVAACL